MTEPVYNPERTTVRRTTDANCLIHESRLDTMDNNIATQGGWLKVGSGLLTIAVFVIGVLCSYIISQLGTIAGLLGKNDVVLMQHSEQIKVNTEDIKEIRERNKYIDQQSGMLGAERRDTLRKSTEMGRQ